MVLFTAEYAEDSGLKKENSALPLRTPRPLRKK
jgi:hypothetical protein